jgi:hypothetical protein
MGEKGGGVAGDEWGTQVAISIIIIIIITILYCYIRPLVFSLLLHLVNS